MLKPLVKGLAMKKTAYTFLSMLSLSLSTTSYADTALNSVAPVGVKDTLSQVMTTKKLRVCSPGDYKPFSYDNNGKFEGIDNDLEPFSESV